MEHNEIVVIKSKIDLPFIKRNEEFVVFVDESFPASAFNEGIRKGFFEPREATLEEKEFCYWNFEVNDRPAIMMELFDAWKKEIKPDFEKATT